MAPLAFAPIVAYHACMADLPVSHYLPTSEAAALAGITPGRLRQLCQAGEVAGAIKLGSAWLIPRQSAESLAAEPSSTGRPRISCRS